MVFPCEKFSNPADCSGYDRQNWKPRNKTDHKTEASKIKIIRDEHLPVIQ